MAIRFTCECGAELTVPDANETSAVLCPSCGKSVAIPAGAAPRADVGDRTPGAKFAAGDTNDDSPSALFRAAIAAFNDTELSEGPSPTAKTDHPSSPPPPLPAPSRDEPKPHPAEGVSAPPAPATPSAEGTPAGADEVPVADEWQEDEESAVQGNEPTRDAAVPATAVASETVGAGAKSRGAMSASAAVEAIERRRLRKAIHREGESDAPGAVYEPTDATLVGDVIKFHCRCGKRISAPVNARKSVGKCPKCGARLSLPKTGAAKPDAAKVAAALAATAPAAPSATEADKKRSANIRSATADAANRLRGTAEPAGPPAAAARASPSPAPSWMPRIVAFQVDAALTAAAFFATAYGLKLTSLRGAAWVVGGVVAVSLWALNKIALTGLSGGSGGMLLAGLRVCRSDSTPVGLRLAALRALAGLLLLPVAPFADAEGRAPADRIAGTTIVSVSGPARG